MSDTIYDKIVNYLVAYKVLRPVLSPTLIEQNVATRKGKGASKAYYFFEKYANLQVQLKRRKNHKSTRNREFANANNVSP